MSIALPAMVSLWASANASERNDVLSVMLSVGGAPILAYQARDDECVLFGHAVSTTAVRPTFSSWDLGSAGEAPTIRRPDLAVLEVLVDAGHAASFDTLYFTSLISVTPLAKPMPDAHLLRRVARELCDPVSFPPDAWTSALAQVGDTGRLILLRYMNEGFAARVLAGRFSPGPLSPMPGLMLECERRASRCSALIDYVYLHIDD